MVPRLKRVVNDNAESRRRNATYKTAVKNFNAVLEVLCAISIATSGRYVETRRGWASALFTRLCTLSTSLKKLIPELATSEFESDYWDYSAVAMLARRNSGMLPSVLLPRRRGCRRGRVARSFESDPRA